MEENKLKNKKIIILVIAILIIAIVGGVIGFFAYQYVKEDDDENWANTYYKSIALAREYEISSQIQDDSQVSFIEVDEIDNPVMVVEYEQDEDECLDIYYINDEKVINKISLSNMDVEFLYNIDEGEYNWYLHQEIENQGDGYLKVSDKILKEIVDYTTYTYKEGETISTETVDGNTISIDKFNTEFVEIDVEIDKFDYTDDLSDEELENSILELAEKYKTNEEIITEEIEEYVERKVEEINAKFIEIQEAENAMKAKEAEEEEKISKGISAGNYTLNYGTYKGRISHYADNSRGSVSVDVTFELKTDGTYTRTYSNSTDTSLYQNITSNGTYEVGKSNGETSYEYVLKFDGNAVLAIIADNTLEAFAGEQTRYTYQGN